MGKTLTYILITVLCVAVLGVAYYALSPLWNNVVLDEALPVSSTPTTDESLPAPVNEHQDFGLGEAQPEASPVVGTTGHPASGTARIVSVDGKNYLRYENFKTINGPDLYVYLATDTSAKDYVDLGRIRATEGNVNYEIPPGTDLSKYTHALVWCKQFSVLFNSADLSS